MIEIFIPKLIEPKMDESLAIKEIKSSSSDKTNYFENSEEPINNKSIENEEVDRPIYLITRNESLEGDVHPITGVPFERRIVETPGKLEGVFPEFDSKFDANIADELFDASDAKQFKECNKQLGESIENNPNLMELFSKEQLDQIKNGDTPDGYSWHHDASPGTLQLVDFETHFKTGHTGGRTVWGGGNENR